MPQVHWLTLGLALYATAQLASCHPCPPPVEAPASQADEASAPAAPLIGVTGYVVLPGTNPDDGLGNFRMTRTYRDALIGAGALAVHLVPVSEDQVEALLDRLDGLVLSGGADIDPATYGEEQHPTVSVLEPERQEFDFALARGAMERGMPILGICLGSQELNVARGGTMIQDIPSEVEGAVDHRRLDEDGMRRGVHELELVEGSPLASLYGRRSLLVNSIHHQASDRLGEGLVVSARTADGVTEGFWLPDYPFLIGVQFHPEIQNEPEGLHEPLFRAFVAAAAEYRARRGQQRPPAAHVD